MYFCEEHVSLIHPWIDNGVSKCFLGTLTGSILSLLLLPFGSMAVILYAKHGAEIPSSLHNNTFLCKMQPFCMILLTVVAGLHLILKAVYLEPQVIYGYVLFEDLVSMLYWPLACILWYYETRFAMPGDSVRRGHGVLLLFFWTVALVFETLPLININSLKWWWHLETSSAQCEFALWLCRFGMCFFLFLLGLRAPALPNLSNYSTLPVGLSDVLSSTAPNSANSTLQRISSLSKLWSKLKLMFPYVWPKNSISLQLRVLICVVLLVLGRVVNIFVPIYYKFIVDSLTTATSNGNSNVTLTEQFGQLRLIDAVQGLLYRWDYILFYVFLRFLMGIGGGGSGFLGNVRTIIWIRVSQYTMREISVRLFSHLHGLSLRWHLSKKTGEVLRVMDRGTSSINSILNYVVFQIMPTLFDIVIGVVYFATFFNLWFGLIVFLTMLLYLVCTILITEWRTKYRREANKLDNEKNAKAVDSLLNFETVKYYGADRFEVERYEKAITDYNAADYISEVTLGVLSVAQNAIINVGFLAGALLCAHYVVVNSRKPSTSTAFTVGDYVLFASYIMQLYTPLNWFGTYYRMIQQQFVDMENMFELLNQVQDVKDVDDAPSLHVSKGEVEFRDVHFHYEAARPVLRGLSFVVPAGTTCALVGQSGSGKSTVIRLLFRFYDVQQGQILIDGQDVADVSQESLRKTIGVVPQDTVLFNENIQYNIRYGRFNASDAEVEAAASAADIHERILTFPDKYSTVVGERGLKLSGGEKQRVAIARTLLKSPRIVLLDEATSALDTRTERTIQASLETVCRGRTTLVVAHRLSTIVGADQILVLHEGCLVERGTHAQLVQQGGRYADMWQQQQSQDEVGEAEKSDDEMLVI